MIWTDSFMIDVDKDHPSYWVFGPDVYLRPLKHYEIVSDGVERVRLKTEVDREVVEWCEWLFQVALCSFDVDREFLGTLNWPGWGHTTPSVSISFKYVEETFIVLYDDMMSGKYKIKDNNLEAYLYFLAGNGQYQIPENWNQNK